MPDIGFFSNIVTIFVGSLRLGGPQRNFLDGMIENGLNGLGKE